MTTATAPTMNPTGLDDHAQSLIDARLDTIERMLLGQVPRADRLAIVRDVESQIHDLLAARNPDDTDRDAVIAALGRLDPPEAYLPDQAGAMSPPARSSGDTRPAEGRRVAVHSGDVAKRSTTGRIAGILGIVAWAILMLSALTFYAASVEQGNHFFLATSGLVLTFNALSVLAITFSALARIRTSWSIVGLVLGLTSLLIGVPYLGL